MSSSLAGRSQTQLGSMSLMWEGLSESQIDFCRLRGDHRHARGKFSFENNAVKFCMGPCV